MKKAALVFVFVLRFGLSAMAQSAADPTFKLALPITQATAMVSGRIQDRSIIRQTDGAGDRHSRQR
jgi:hypothetical protein